MIFFSTKFGLNRSLLKIKQYAYGEKYLFSSRLRKKRDGPRQGTFPYSIFGLEVINFFDLWHTHTQIQTSNIFSKPHFWTFYIILNNVT